MKNSTLPIQRPPGPPHRFLGLSLLSEMKRDYLGFARGLHRDYGDVVYTRVGPEHFYSVACPDLSREILVDKAQSFHRWEHHAGVFAEDHGQSVLTTDGELWQRQRRMLQPGFSAKSVQGYSAMVADTARDMLDGVPAQAEQGVDFERLMTQLTITVINQAMFGIKSPADNEAAAHATHVIAGAHMRKIVKLVRLPDWLPLPGNAETRWARRTLNELIWRHIRQRRSDPAEHHDLLAMLLSVREDGKGLDDQEVRDQCMSMFLAGHETTAAGLTWWGWCMANHPQFAQRAADEVDHVLGGRLPTHADIAALGYLGQSLKESLRLYPPGAALFVRRAIEDVQVGPWRVPKGSLINITPWVLQRDGRWFENPDAFNPDHFGPGAGGDRPRGAYIPFGAGPRVCLGNTLAVNEMTLVAAMLLQRFQLAPAAGSVQPVLRATLRPATSLHLRLKRRPPGVAVAQAAAPAPALAGAEACPHLRGMAAAPSQA